MVLWLHYYYPRAKIVGPGVHTVPGACVIGALPVAPGGGHRRSGSWPEPELAWDGSQRAGICRLLTSWIRPFVTNKPTQNDLPTIKEGFGV